LVFFVWFSSCPKHVSLYCPFSLVPSVFSNIYSVSYYEQWNNLYNKNNNLLCSWDLWGQLWDPENLARYAFHYYPY
jgi:hypothetical protein